MRRPERPWAPASASGEVRDDGHSGRGGSSAGEGARPRVNRRGGRHELAGGAGHGAESTSRRLSDQAAALGGRVIKGHAYETATRGPP